MHGDIALQIVRELHRSKWMPPYHKEELRRISQEVKVLNQMVEEVVHAEGFDRNDASSTCGVFLHVQCIFRNKRCALAYLMTRLRKIEELWWQTGTGSFVSDDLAEILSAGEKAYLTTYSNILNDYMQDVDVDLNLDLQPPKSMYVECRVLKDCGEIETESGTIALQENTTHFLRRRDAELLIRQGFLKHIE